MSEVKPKIHHSWLNILQKEFEAPYFKELQSFLINERSLFKVYPKKEFVFEAFNQTPFNKIKVVIIGQDPYHGPEQANGLSFSVQDGIKQPPSLRNIFKELKSDLGLSTPVSGNLIKWAKEGVLMLNATLTVREQTPGSHQNKGWETFTDVVIKAISEQSQNVVFMLWGKYAQDKGNQINKERHCIIKSAHPSPFSAYRGFFESQPFSKTNNYLQSKGIKPVDWEL